MFSRGRGARLGLCAVLLFSGIVQAAVTVSPLRVQFTAAREVKKLTIHNPGDQPVRIQLTTTRWEQDDNGADRDTDTRELLATPPVFELAPGASQLVRVGLRRAPEPGRELAYHLYVRELPPAGTPEMGVRFRLQHAVPVFVRGAPELAPIMQWRLEPAAEGLPRLMLSNPGTAHARITAVQLATLPGGEVLLDWTGVLYALAGEAIDSSLLLRGAAPSGSALRLSVQHGVDGLSTRSEYFLTAP